MWRAILALCFTLTLLRKAFSDVTLTSWVTQIGDWQCQKQLVCHVTPEKNKPLSRLLEISLMEKTTGRVLKQVASVYYLHSQNASVHDGDQDTTGSLVHENGGLTLQTTLAPNTGFSDEKFVCRVVFLNTTFAVDFREVGVLDSKTEEVCVGPDLFHKLSVLEKKINKLYQAEVGGNNGGNNKNSTTSCQCPNLCDQLNNIETKLDRLTHIEDKLAELLSKVHGFNSTGGGGVDNSSRGNNSGLTSCDRFRDVAERTDLSLREVVTWTDGTRVLCDTETDGGGWTIFQRRFNGSVDFYRNWEEYEFGFGNVNSEFWLGLAPLYRLLQTGNYEMRVDLKYKGSSYYAQYSSFTLSSASSNYKFNTGSYSGTAGNSMSRNNGYPFSTYDQDHDSYGGNCAVKYHGGWWYDACHEANLNGLWGSTDYAKGLTWRSITDYYSSVNFSEMKVRRRQEV